MEMFQNICLNLKSQYKLYNIRNSYIRDLGLMDTSLGLKCKMSNTLESVQEDRENRIKRIAFVPLLLS